MNKRRLLKLADLLDADSKNKKGICFDFTLWGEVEDEHNPVSCGTTACALGLAAVSGVFKKQGLKYRVRGGCLGIGFKRTWHPATVAARFFDITLSDAYELFVHSSGLPSAAGAKAERAVAKRIRNFVAGKASP